MNFVGNLFRTTIGRKFLMAVTGVVLIIFIIGHLVGNLQVFENPDRINGYAHFLQSLGPALWIERVVLFLCAAIHVWAATVLVLADRRARGPVPYRVKTWLQATVASRYMRWTGYVVLAFIVFHLAQFTLGAVTPETYKANLPPYIMAGDYHVLGFIVVRAGTPVLDVHTMVIKSFQNAAVSWFYIAAVGLLSLHLVHGADSLFQTFGWRNARWASGLQALVAVGCLAYFLGNVAIPGAVMCGALEPRPVAAAANSARP